MNLYDVPKSATMAEYLAWYKDQLKGFRYVHKNWSGLEQDMFYSSNGSMGVGLTGDDKGPGVYAVTYIKLSANLTTHQMDEFSPSNPSCK